jgi:hypothetical protein
MERRVMEKADVQFFALASLEVEFRIDRDVRPSASTATVTLKNFVIPQTIKVRSKVRKWSDYIDYWAVDWDFQDDVFTSGWVTYRSPKDRTLALTSELHVYQTPGKYRVVVKVVDIFGNETSQEVNFEV